MRALLVVAHGSRRAESNDEVRSLTEQIRSNAGAEFELIECAFLELAEPSIPDGIQQCVTAGASEVVVVPYFLSAGRHVAEDIPEIVAEYLAKNPKVKVKVADYLGTASALPQIMLKLAGE